MEFQEIVNLIGSLGFPIGMCLLFWHFIQSALQKITDIVNKNTEAVNTLVLKLDIIDAINEHEKEHLKKKED